MLKIIDLQVSYPGQVVISGLTLELSSGKIHGIAGLNGSGKTTLLNAVYGFIEPDNGEVEFMGEKLTRTSVAFLETGNYFYSRITGREYLELFALSNPAFEIEQWNRLFDLPLKELTETYSTGMKKKLALLGVLCLDKPLLLLDEPFNGLDLESNRVLYHILKKLKEKGKTIIITSHIMETLTGNCDTVSFLNNKNIERSFAREEFHHMEESIFRLHDDRNRELINGLLGISPSDKKI